MSKTLDIHHGSAVTVLINIPGEGAYLAKGTTVPTDGASGFAKGCLFIDTDASAGSILLCNEGTSASCDFDAISVA